MATALKSKKNLTRFDRSRTAFDGWRLYISRKGSAFMRYFSDRQYGGARKSLQAAEASLEKVKGILETGIRNGRVTKKAIAAVNRELKIS